MRRSALSSGLALLLALLAGCSGARFGEAPSSVITSRIDGADWKDQLREDYTYVGQQLASVQRTDLTASGPGNAQRVDYVYTDDRLHTVTGYEHSTESVAAYRVEYAYDDDDRLATTTRFERVTAAGELTVVSRTRYSYDADDQLSNIVVESWSFTSETFVPSLKTSYTYDDDGRVLTEENGYWEGAGERVDRRVLLSYDGDGRLSTLTVDNGQGTSESRTTFQYEGDALTSVLDERPSGSGWSPREKFEIQRVAKSTTITRSSYENDRWRVASRKQVSFIDTADSRFYEGAWFPQPLWTNDVPYFYGVSPWNRYAK